MVTVTLEQREALAAQDQMRLIRLIQTLDAEQAKTMATKLLVTEEGPLPSWLHSNYPRFLKDVAARNTSNSQRRKLTGFLDEIEEKRKQN